MEAIVQVIHQAEIDDALRAELLKSILDIARSKGIFFCSVCDSTIVKKDGGVCSWHCRVTECGCKGDIYCCGYVENDYFRY